MSVDTLFETVGRRPQLLLAVHDMERPGGGDSERKRPALAHLSTSWDGGNSVNEQLPAGVAGQQRPAADRPGEAARRAGELPPVTCQVSVDLRRCCAVTGSAH